MCDFLECDLICDCFLYYTLLTQRVYQTLALVTVLRGRVSFPVRSNFQVAFQDAQISNRKMCCDSHEKFFRSNSDFRCRFHVKPLKPVYTSPYFLKV